MSNVSLNKQKIGWLVNVRHKNKDQIVMATSLELLIIRKMITDRIVEILADNSNSSPDLKITINN